MYIRTSGRDYEYEAEPLNVLHLSNTNIIIYIDYTHEDISNCNDANPVLCFTNDYLVF